MDGMTNEAMFSVLRTTESEAAADRTPALLLQQSYSAGRA